jgi:hypothetical protein
MGYDMYTVQGADQAENEAVAAARRFIDNLPKPWDQPEGTERDAAQKQWDDAWRAFDRAQTSYFRLNIWGMSACVDLMADLGMMTDEDAPKFPSPADYGLTEYPDDPADYEGDERAAIEAKLTDADRQFLAACRAVVDYEPEPVGGIPVGKFSSNDGWLVTPRQIAAALEAYAAATEGARAAATAKREWFADWIAWLGHAKDRGGFRVR